MTSRISHTSFDAINAYAQSVFWSQVLASLKILMTRTSPDTRNA
jgi:hypothetical protein